MVTPTSAQLMADNLVLTPGQCGLPHGGTAVGVPDTAQSLASIVRQAEAHWTECHA